MKTGRWFKCDYCGYEGKSGWTEGESHAEYNERYPELIRIEQTPRTKLAKLCDDCDIEFRKWMANLTPEQKKQLERDASLEGLLK